MCRPLPVCRGIAAGKVSRPARSQGPATATREDDEYATHSAPHRREPIETHGVSVNEVKQNMLNAG
jgi:hypothetical protein